MNYESRLLIPIQSQILNLYTKSKLQIATGYRRIVIGERGPYIEFEKKDLIFNNFYIPEDKKIKLTYKNCYYIEYRSIDKSFLKLYFQKRAVNYANYLVGKYYISPFDLYLENGEKTIRRIVNNDSNIKCKPRCSDS
jgi:hypothetical protein